MTSKVYRAWGATHFLLFLFAWALPMVGLSLVDGTPRGLSNQFVIFYRLAALFTKRSSEWSDRHVQVRELGRADWATLNVLDYDGVCVYGYSNRIDRALTMQAGRRPGALGPDLWQQFGQQIADYVARRHAVLFPDRPALAEVRFVRVSWPVAQTRFMTAPPGRWTDLPASLVPANRTFIISAHRVNALPVSERAVEIVDESDAELASLLRARVVTNLNLARARRITSRGIAAVSAEPELERLSLAGRRLTLADLQHLQNLTELRELNLTGAVIPAGAELAISQLPRLEVLRLGGADLSALAPEVLRSLSRLQVLDLSRSKAPGKVLRSLRWWPDLEELWLGGATGVAHELKGLRSHAKLRSLDLSSTDTGDGNLPALAGMPALRFLGLDDTAVSTAGLPSLKGLSNLRHLSAGGTPLVADGAALLRTELTLSHLRQNGRTWEPLSGKPGLEPAKPAQKN